MQDQLINLMPSIFFIMQGVIVTLKYSIISVFLGFLIGLALAIFKIGNNIILKSFASAYTSIFRGTPLIMQLSIIYYCVPSLINMDISIFAAGITAFSLNSGAYVSEVIRAGLNSVDKGQYDAAYTLNIPRSLVLKDIILPQALKNILPSLINELINMVKESAVISIIGEVDLMRRAQLVSAETYNFFIPLISAAIAYYFLVLIISTFAKILENRLSA